MDDLNGQEQAAPAKRSGPQSSGMADKVLASVGVAMAVAAAMYPWYVFFNQDKFGVRLADWGNTRDLPEGPGRSVFSVSPLAMIDKDNKGPKIVTEQQIDQLSTATVSKRGAAGDSDPEAKPSQPFPGRSGFQLLHVANGRALIEDNGGMYMVQVGSMLPDNSRVATLEMRDGKWVIITSNGDIYENR
ncbi:flagellar protein [Agrobacterium sp. ES01]|uniref:flagellar protein n=1 Tax=Agrobacterium sp. ES01 TaxID=3420714 RepID=UPI003D0F903D